MAIENVQVKVKQVKTSAVCCIANLPLETINTFLASVWEQEENEATAHTPATHTLTVIHDLQTHFWGATQKLQSEDPDTILQSPFTGLTYPQIKEKLVQMKENTDSTIATHWFLVLDERSAGTESAVMVNVESSHGGEHALRSGVRSLRVEYATSSRYLAAASIAHPSIGELKEIVDGDPQKYRGILRDE